MDPSLRSEEVSSLGENDKDREEHNKRLQEAAGLSNRDIDDGVDSWEIFKPAHRVPKVWNMHLSPSEAKLLDSVWGDNEALSQDKKWFTEGQQEEARTVDKAHQTWSYPSKYACLWHLPIHARCHVQLVYLLLCLTSQKSNRFEEENPLGFDEATNHTGNEAAGNSDLMASDEDEDNDDGVNE